MPIANFAEFSARLSGLGRQVWGIALDVVLPPQCLACSALVGVQGSICTPCWHDIDFLAQPHCYRCGYPFELDQGEAALCGACIRQPPVYHRARSVMVYGGVARDLVLGFKHGDRTHAAPAFGRWLARAGAELIADADLILPVPLHRWRLARRRFNQAALMAGTLADITDKPMRPNILRRIRQTSTQGGLNRRQRARNVRRAFIVQPRHQAGIAGKRILLVDDVLTTGATAGECAATLLRGGAAAVDVLTLTRVVRPES
ncbi:MAG: ComF family protein [Alphaproteobacteria bacterium]